MLYPVGSSKIDKTHALVAKNGGWGSVYQKYSSLYDCFTRPGKEFPCPKTGNGKTKFSFFRNGADDRGAAMHRDIGALGDGIEVISWFEGVDTSKALDIIIDILGGDTSKITQKDIKRVAAVKREMSENPIPPEQAKQRKSTLQRIWKDAQPIQGTLAETYLRSRGMKGDAGTWNNLYFHPSLPYKEDDDAPWQRFPGMLAVVRNHDGKSVTLHRTFLNADGTSKAPVTRQKMLLAQPIPLNGACIMLDNPTDTPIGKIIGVTEGIENALSIREATGCPMWSGISDRIMEKIIFPDEVKIIIVWADIEPSGAGLRAAETLRSIWEPKGKQVVVEAPHFLNREKADWNDVYAEMGALGFNLKLSSDYRVYTGVEVPL